MRTWVWGALALQLAGYVFDVSWHALRPEAEPKTVEAMLRHLLTVHLPLYVGAASVLLATLVALVRASRRSTAPPALAVAAGGAVVSAAAEAWHAASHLRLDTHTAPLAGILSVVGFLIVVVAMALSRGRRAQRAGR